MALGRIAFTFAGTSLWTALTVFAALAFALILSGHVALLPCL